MKESPILFSAAMVRAILNGTKTQTRRVLKSPTPFMREFLGKPCRYDGLFDSSHWLEELDEKGEPTETYIPVGYCPYGEVGDRLWVRETFQEAQCVESNMEGFVYAADVKDLKEFKELNGSFRWKPSIFMPRVASRIMLEITDVRVERLNNISEADAIAEGIDRFRPVPGDGPAETMYKHYTKNKWGPSAVHSYETLWNSINGPEAWDENPYVWVVSFRRIMI